MKKKLLFPCLLLTVAMLFTCAFAFGASAAETLSMTDVANGTKTPAAGDIVTISSANELVAFSKYVSDGGATEGITFRMDADVALEPSTGRTPVTNLNPVGGTYNGASEAQAFKGIFDGNGKTITNLQFTGRYKVNPSDTSNKTADGASTASSQYTGLFAKLDGAIVKDLSVVVYGTAAVSKGGEFGVIAAYAKNATVTGCTVTAGSDAKIGLAVTALGFGGVVGYAEDSVIDSCSVNMKATGVGATAGAVAKAVNTSVRNCVIGGEYIIDKQGVLGGIVAEMSGTSCVENCYSFAKLSATTAATAGSVIGGVVADVAEGTWVENCFSAATINMGGTNYVFGSLVGENNGKVAHSFGLRGLDKQDNESHNDIGLNNGVTEEVFAYQPQVDADGATKFVVGSVVVAPKQYACTGGTCGDDIDPACTACGGDGLVERLASVFVPTDDAAMASLDGALNAWVAEKASSDVKYASWMISGDTIVNCAHPKTVYRPYDNQAPTCSAVGHGDLVCAGCNTVLKTDVEIPVDPAAHASEDGKVYTCVSFNCIHCNKDIEATADHAIDVTKQCMDQTCTRCHQLINGNGQHTKPEGFDESKPCAEYACTVCATVTHDVDHDAPAVEYDCQESVCKVCDAVVHKAGPHFAGLAANCERAQLCLDCGVVINPAKGHKWGEAATCGKAQMCDDCGKANPDAPATGEHVGDREAPTCTQGVYCVVCAKRLKGAAGHKTDASAEIDCGHGKSCTVCHTILESATGEHNVDWSTATVIRPATEGRTGIVEGECTDCGRKVEAFTVYQVSESSGVIQAYGSNDKIFTGTKLLLTIGKVKDYANVTLTEGYLALQAVTASAVNTAGEPVDLAGSITVKMILNKSAAKMATEKLKLYQVKNGVATEITITAVEDGYITFTASGLGEFIIAGEKTAAFETLGAIQPKQTAALIGTPAYEKKDEI